jgi:hypothetical protein
MGTHGVKSDEAFENVVEIGAHVIHHNRGFLSDTPALIQNIPSIRVPTVTLYSGGWNSRNGSEVDISVLD